MQNFRLIRRQTSVFAVMTALLFAMATGCGPSASTPDAERAVDPKPVDSKSSGLPPIPKGGIQLPPQEVLDAPAPELDEAPVITVPVTDSPSAMNSKSNILVEPWDAVQQRVSAKGITVVDVWSLSCAPCLEEFPGLVRLHKEGLDQVQCLAVSVDFDGRKTRPPESYRDQVQSFIASVHANAITTVICSTPIDEVLKTIEVASIPTVLVYQDGKLVKKFTDSGQTSGFTYEKDIDPMVRKLVQP